MFIPSCNSDPAQRARTLAMMEFEEEFRELIKQLHLPEDVLDALAAHGYDCTLTFGLAFSSITMLDQHMQKFLQAGDTDLTSPTCARIRALWTRCNNMHRAPPIQAAQPSPSPPAASPSSLPTQAQNWHETVPPKLSFEDMETMKVQFGRNYPGEVLDPHSTPSVRLWSLVHQQKVTKLKQIKHIPIQLRLSEHQYCSMIETRSSKPLGSEIQLLSQLCWDDTPEMDINAVRFSHDWLHRTSTVLRNAYVLCGMCHLQIFKAFDTRVSELTFPQLDSEFGLRQVMAQEFLQQIGRFGTPLPTSTQKEPGPSKSASTR